MRNSFGLLTKSFGNPLEMRNSSGNPTTSLNNCEDMISGELVVLN